MSKFRIFILSGDQSGDNHAGKLMASLLAINPEIEFFGIGGETMARYGLNSIANLKDISVVGFWEVAKKYSFFKKLLEKCTNELIEKKIDLFLPVDFPGFNLRLAKFAKKEGIPVLYYIAPQIWAWGKGRLEEIKENINEVIPILPFEEEYFQSSGIKATYLGHPILDNSELNKEFNPYHLRNKSIILMPGSRKQELKKHKELVSELCNSLKNKLPEYKLIIFKSKLLDESYYKELWGNHSNLEVKEQSYSLMAESMLGIIKTGTSTLEAGLAGLPYVMFYKTSPLTYHISKYLINLDYISLPNVIMKKPIVKELIQNEATADGIVSEIMQLVENQESYNKMLSEFEKLRENLGITGASKRIATYINTNYIVKS